MVLAHTMFLKPIESRTRETWGETKLYYLAWVPGGVTKHLARRKLQTGPNPEQVFVWAHSGVWLDKKQVDRFPKYLRRGGEYGHDTVRLELRPPRGGERLYGPEWWEREQRREHKQRKRQCKRLGLEFVVTVLTN